MTRRWTFMSLALLAVFNLQVADCMSPISADHQAMSCCKSGACTPGRHSHDCCKTMVSIGGPTLLVTHHFALAAPLLLVADYIFSRRAAAFSADFRPEFRASQHSPPELYALHSSFRI